MFKAQIMYFVTFLLKMNLWTWRNLIALKPMEAIPRKSIILLKILFPGSDET